MKKVFNSSVFIVVSLSLSPLNSSAQVMTKERAVAIEVMMAMGGQENFANLRYLSWDFFGKRSLVWDKWNGMVRIDYLDESLSMVVSLNEDKVMVVKDNLPVTDQDSLSDYLTMGRQIWMNDSYWLCMPFKLLDKGVSLKYLGKGETVDGSTSQLLQMTFNNVGQTPENKYHVHIDPQSKLIIQWDFFIRAEEELPTFTTPWTDYKWYGRVQFAAGRGAFGNFENIRTWDEIPSRVFTNLMVPALPKK